MSPIKAVLDASAIVALVLKERGADVVQQIIAAGVAGTTPTGLAEALTVCRRKGYQGSNADLLADLDQLGLRVEPLVAEDAKEMAFLLAASDRVGSGGGQNAAKLGSLSLGDAACLAVAVRLGVPAVVSDGTWELLDVSGLSVRPFR